MKKCFFKRTFRKTNISKMFFIVQFICTYWWLFLYVCIFVICCIFCIFAYFVYYPKWFPRAGRREHCAWKFSSGGWGGQPPERNTDAYQRWFKDIQGRQENHAKRGAAAAVRRNYFHPPTCAPTFTVPADTSDLVIPGSKRTWLIWSAAHIHT